MHGDTGHDLYPSYHDKTWYLQVRNVASSLYTGNWAIVQAGPAIKTDRLVPGQHVTCSCKTSCNTCDVTWVAYHTVAKQRTCLVLLLEVAPKLTISPMPQARRPALVPPCSTQFSLMHITCGCSNTNWLLSLVEGS